MKQGVKKSKKQKIEIAKKICDMYATDNYTLSDCCKANKVNSDSTFYIWCDEIKEIKELYKSAKLEAENAFSERIKIKARSSFEKKIEGFHIDLEELIYENTKDGKPKIKTKKISKKYYPPSDTLIQVALYNKDPDNFRDKRNLELSGPKGGPVQLESLDTEGLSVSEKRKLLALLNKMDK